MVQTWVLGSDKETSHSSSSNVRIHNRSPRRGRTTVALQAGVNSAKWKLARSLFVLIAFLILFSGFTLMRTFADESSVKPVNGQELVVMADSGDTLWGIAQSVKQEGLDTREAIHRIMKRNGLTTSELHSGENLIIPAEILGTRTGGE